MYKYSIQLMNGVGVVKSIECRYETIEEAREVGKKIKYGRKQAVALYCDEKFIEYVSEGDLHPE